jgi:hypothetical protein
MDGVTSTVAEDRSDRIAQARPAAATLEARVDDRGLDVAVRVWVIRVEPIDVQDTSWWAPSVFGEGPRSRP